VNEPLISRASSVMDRLSEFSITKEELSDLFHPDNIKNHS